MVEPTQENGGEQGPTLENVYAGSNVVSEFTIQDAQALTNPTDKILCTLADNRFIRFGEYSVVDADTRTQLIAVDSEQNKNMDDFARQME